jgi:hypothetical protein
MKGLNFWVLVFFALINNGCSLLGFGQGSVGGVARSIEFRYEVAQDIATQKAQKLIAGNPPHKYGEAFSGVFQIGVV